VLERLDATIRDAGIPITGVSRNSVEYLSTATPQQRTQGDAILASFDWSSEAHAAWEENQNPERKGIRQAAATAIADNEAFLADTNVTTAEAIAQVKRLTQQNNRIIKRLIQI